MTSNTHPNAIDLIERAKGTTIETCLRRLRQRFVTVFAQLRFCFWGSWGADEAEGHYATTAPANQLRVAASPSLNMVAYSIWKETRKATEINQRT